MDFASKPSFPFSSDLYSFQSIQLCDSTLSEQGNKTYCTLVKRMVNEMHENIDTSCSFVYLSNSMNVIAFVFFLLFH